MFSNALPRSLSVVILAVWVLHTDRTLSGEPLESPAQHSGVGVLFVDASAEGANDGSSWASAYRSLQGALFDAASSGGLITEIWVASGTYMPDGGYTPNGGTHVPGSGDRTATFQLLNGVALYGGFAGGESDLAQRDIAANQTILSGDLNGDDPVVACSQDKDCPGWESWCIEGTCMPTSNSFDNSYHVVTGSGTDATAILDGFKVLGGNADGLAGNPRYGGGMYNDNGSPTVAHCHFRRNVASDGGGGMYNANGSNPTVAGCTFSGNLLYLHSGGRGGGMYNINNSGPTVTDSVFERNSAPLGVGGGIMNVQNSSIFVSNCIFRENLAMGGGGIVSGQNSNPTIANSLFDGNISSSESGGGIVSFDNLSTLVTGNTIIRNKGHGVLVVAGTPIDVSVIVTDNLIADNIATNELGGGVSINLQLTGSVEVSNNVITGNAALNGGGVFLSGDSSTQMLVANNRISENSAEGSGGGVVFYHCRNSTLVNNSITSNMAQHAGGILVFQSYLNTLSGNRIINNKALNGEGGGIRMVASPATLYDNVIIRNSATGRGGAIATRFFGSGYIIQNSVLANNMAMSPDMAGALDIGSSIGMSLSTAGEQGPVVLLGNTSFDISNGNWVVHSADDLEAQGVWWGTQNTQDIESRIWDYFDDDSLTMVHWDPPAPTGPFDFTGDGEILRDDLTEMVACLGGPDAPIEEPCRLGDLDRNGVVDLFDFATFQTVVRAP